MTLVWEHYPTGGGELLTALAYADHAHDDGTGIRPSVAYMARKTRQSERTIQMHLASMRLSGWLLTVRHAFGGRGRATEYRVNPAWIANPADFAPFPKATQRVQPNAGKGAIDSTKGCKAFAPQPPRNISEPTTTLVAGKELAVVVGHDELIWPACLLDGGERISAEKLLRSCPPLDRQDVLDELAGQVEGGHVRDRINYLRGLVKSAKAGLFSPAAALKWRRKRESEAAVVKKRVDDDQHREQQSTPQARESGRKRLALARQQLGLRGSTQ